jgi:hypothetical protein
MTGAPFWRLVDFAGPIPGHVRGPVEAALQAAGLLDAWVGPSGSIPSHDIFADPGALAPAPGRSLADVLVPEPAAAVPTVAVRQLLISVAFGDHAPSGHPAAIGADGSWRLGNLHGTWHKDHPGHIGAMARQRARAADQELTSRLDACAESIATAEAGSASCGTDASLWRTKEGPPGLPGAERRRAGGPACRGGRDRRGPSRPPADGAVSAGRKGGRRARDADQPRSGERPAR